MNELIQFGTIVLVVAAGFSLAVMARSTSHRFGIPAPALFLLAAAVASDLRPELAESVSILTVERIGVVALIIILFDGGMHVGWRRFRGSAVPISALGILGTFATGALMAAVAHWLFGFSWTTAGILGAALAPTDPAVMFSVFGNREVRGRTGTILEGESGANDPVGIALMVAMVELAEGDGTSGLDLVTEFSIEMAVGLVVGVLGAAALLPLMRRVPMPDESLYPLRTLFAAGVIYGLATVAHGSGFLAVFVAGLLIGDARAPYKAEIERFHTALASLAEIVVFVALGLTIDITELAEDNRWLEGLALAVILAFVARPLVTAPLLLPARLRWGERIFVMWGGLKGAVPILLTTFPLLAGVEDAERIYGIVFVVVAFSVLVQGTTLPLVAPLLGVRMRTIEAEPWDLSIRMRTEPTEIQRYVVGRGARASGTRIRDLPLGERTWISLLLRDGKPQRASGGAVLRPGDELLVLCDDRDAGALRRLFEGSVPAETPVD